MNTIIEGVIFLLFALLMAVELLLLWTRLWHS